MALGMCEVIYFQMYIFFSFFSLGVEKGIMESQVHITLRKCLEKHTR